MKKLVLNNVMSEEKSKKLEKLAQKILKFAQENGISKLSFCFISKDCDVTKSDLDYIDTVAFDRYDNQLYDVAQWG